MAMTLPNKGPYHPDNADVPDPGEGMAISAFPFDQKWMDDMGWYDQLGRSLIEQRRILTVPRSDEERVEMVKQALEDAEMKARQIEEEGDIDVDQDEIEKRLNDRLWSVCLEVAMKGSGAVMQYLVREKGLNAATAPPKIKNMGVDIHLASHNGFSDVVQVLVKEAGADINYQHEDEDDYRTPLSQAAMGGHVETVRWLLENGADISISDKAQDCVFGSAAESGNLEVMNILLAAARERAARKSGSDFIRNYVLGSAAQSASVGMLKFVLEQGGYGKAIDNTEQQRRDAILAIPLSIRNDNTDWTCLDTVIDCAVPRDASGAFVQSDDEFLIDNLSAAISNSCVRVKPQELKKLLQLLLDATTMTRESDRFKRVLNEAIHRCYDPKSEPCARELLENWGTDPNVNDADDKRDPWPLPLAPGAVSRGNIEWVRFWLDHGADIHRAHGPYCNGPTALILAITLRKWDIAAELLEYGGPVDKMDDDLVGRIAIYANVYGSEMNSVELTATQPSNQDAKVLVLNWENGISQDWVNKIQLRRPDAELAQDGTGRPRKGRHT
jgi:ankyrin repeat protein